MRARSRALLSAGEDADALYREAIDRLGRSSILVHVARAQLLYGEWLRREQRVVDARGQLRKVFTKLAISSRRELRGALPGDRRELVPS